MIGLLVGESQYVFEVNPIMGGPYKSSRQLKIKHNRCTNYGEYGISFSKGRDLRDHTVWFHWGLTTWTWDFDRLIYTLKQKGKLPSLRVIKTLIKKLKGDL